MLVVAFDAVSIATFGAAAVVLVAGLARRRHHVFALAAVPMLASSVLMAAVGAGNFLNALLGSSRMDALEERWEVFVFPLLVYSMYGLYSWAQKSRSQRHRRIVAELNSRIAGVAGGNTDHRVEILNALATAVDARDHYTAQHSLNVADYAVAVANRIRPGAPTTHIEQAALLHDIGKIGVPDHILRKSSKLTEAEYATIKRHSELGAEIVNSVSALAALAPAVLHHHERWDGDGYPGGLAGEQIPWEARVLAVADAFDAMTTHRPYREPLSLEAARSELVRARGSQLEPETVDAMIAIIDETLMIMDNVE